jgi:hypothetical protein
MYEAESINLIYRRLLYEWGSLFGSRVTHYRYMIKRRNDVRYYYFKTRL